MKTQTLESLARELKVACGKPMNADGTYTLTFANKDQAERFGDFIYGYDDSASPEVNLEKLYT